MSALRPKTEKIPKVLLKQRIQGFGEVFKRVDISSVYTNTNRLTGIIKHKGMPWVVEKTPRGTVWQVSGLTLAEIKELVLGIPVKRTATKTKAFIEETGWGYDDRYSRDRC